MNLTRVPSGTSSRAQVVRLLIRPCDRETNRWGRSNSTISSSVVTKKAEDFPLGAHARPDPLFWSTDPFKLTETGQPGEGSPVIRDEVKNRLDRRRNDRLLLHVRHSCPPDLTR